MIYIWWMLRITSLIISPQSEGVKEVKVAKLKVIQSRYYHSYGCVYI